MTVCLLCVSLLACDGDAECEPILPSFDCDYSNHETYQCDGCGRTSLCSCHRPGIECDWLKSDITCDCVTDEHRLDESRDECYWDGNDFGEGD